MKLISNIFSNQNLFLYLTSFVHYIRYISTYQHPKDINFNNFKRDVIIFKSIAIINIILIVKNYFDGNFTSYSSILIITGLLIVFSALYKLGVDHNYFGAELGKVKSKNVNGFPYNIIPYPMIMGQIVVLIGILMIKGIYKDYKYYFILHILFYVMHMTQEEYYNKN